MGDAFSRSEILEGHPPEIAIFKISFSVYLQFFRFSIISQIKRAKSEKKSDFGGRRFDSLNPQKT